MRRRHVLGAVAALAVGAPGALYGLTACGSSAPAPSAPVIAVHGTQTNVLGETVPRPGPSSAPVTPAGIIAQQRGYTGFTECGPGATAGLTGLVKPTDVGTAQSNGVTLTIFTFAGQENMEAFTVAADEGAGMGQPLYEGQWWAAYLLTAC